MERFYRFVGALKLKAKNLWNSELNFALEFKFIEFAFKLAGKFEMLYNIKIILLKLIELFFEND